MRPNPIPTLTHWGLPPLLGAISVFGFAPFGLFPLPILALAALHVLLRDDSPARAGVRGGLFGLGGFLAGVSWVYVSLHEFGQMPAALAVFATLAFCAYLALFPALALALTRLPNLTASVRGLVWAPALWASLEWLRGTLFTGFPWQSIGYSQVPDSPLAGYAPILGVYGVSWLAALSAAMLALLFMPGRTRLGRSGLIGALLAIWVAGAALQNVGWIRPTGAPVSVTLLQGNVAQELKFEPDHLIATLDDYQRMILDSRARLIVTPETALPLFLEHIPPDYLDILARHGRANGGDVLVGLPIREPDGRYYNSMLSLGSGPVQTYAKVHLVPFGEFVPWGFGWIVDYLKIPLSDFSAGAPDQAPMAVAGQQVALNICYEDVFGEELIHALPEATLMVNVSNDAWFGQSAAPWQHLQISQMRALETGRWWLRANNTGITAILDEKGRVRDLLPPFVQASLHGEAQGMAGLTPYARWGNAAILTLLALSLVLALGARRRVSTV